MSRKLVSTACLLVWTLAITGCGKQAFVVTNTVQKEKGPGTFAIPPKVDIVFAEDDTGGMAEIRSQIATQFPKFLTNLDSRGWDYHFATIPLTSDRELTQVVASKFDSNWGSQWLKPYPWALPGEEGTIESFLFKTPTNYSGFLPAMNYGTGSIEDGFDNIASHFQNRFPGTSFIRPDAMLVVLAMGDGQDTSGVNKCRRSDNLVVDCEAVTSDVCTSMSQVTSTIADKDHPHCGSRNLSFNYYKNELKALKPVPSMVQFHAAVAQNTSCRGGSAFIGTRYMDMAAATGGRSYNICTQQVSTVLDTLASSLQETRVSFKTKYIFIASEPDESTIRVVKYLNDDPAQAIEIPHDPDNGWTYAGYLNDVYTVDEPFPMNLGSGYAIELNGFAKLVGSDTAEVIYRAAGATEGSGDL